MTDTLGTPGRVSTVEAEVCIVGGGATGLVLGEALAAQGHHVLVLERGSARADRHSHAVNLVDDVGHPLGPISRRRRFALGGAGRVWAGVSLEFEAIDLVSSANGEETRWPIDFSELSTYYRRARDVLGLPTASGPQDRHPAVATVPLQRSTVAFGSENVSNGPALRLGARVTRVEYRRGPHAGPVDVVAVERSGREFRVRADVVVLAAGGIEVPRLLLASDIGTRGGLVGGYFADHPYLTIPVELPSGEVPPRELVWDGDRLPPLRLAVRSHESRRAGDGLGAAAFFRPGRDPRIWDRPGVHAWSEIAWSRRSGDRMVGGIRQYGRVAKDVADVVRAARDRRTPSGGWAMRVVVEPPPDPNSRITLSDGVDGDGQSVARVDWRLADTSRRTLDAFLADLSDLAVAEGWGPIRYPEGPMWPDRVEGAAHHMGSTRMHTDPGRGVVDEVLRVHDTANLYVVGPSVFPTFGYANPMLTCVALALRLSDHLHSALAGSG